MIYKSFCVALGLLACLAVSSAESTPEQCKQAHEMCKMYLPDPTFCDSTLANCLKASCPISLIVTAEGCNQKDRTCKNSCGCSFVRSSDGSAEYAKIDHGQKDTYYRGTNVLQFKTGSTGKAVKVAETFFHHPDVAQLATHLNSIPAGNIVAVATNDEPFSNWRGGAKTAANAALNSMGLPSPNNGNDPEYRASYAAVGVAGCKKSGNCPSWAGGIYTSRYTSIAVYKNC